MTADFGSGLPHLVTAIPGPSSQSLARRLARVESRNITSFKPLPPIFWEEARGANVRDSDGNIYIDLTAGFGVAAAGHSAAGVTDAIASQARRLAHGLGDVHPSAVKVELLEKLADITPGNLSVGILASAGSEAVEAALKTALLRTGRPGVLAFEGSYHGLTYGALATTHRAEFREPFLKQLFKGVHFAPFPTNTAQLADALSAIDALLAEFDIGAIIVEPIQGRGGIRLPAAGFLQALRDRCDGDTRVLLFDEIYTGLGRTGRWFACEHSGVLPDLLLLGKGLTGSIALSAVLGTPDVMQAWPLSEGEALHTSTFLGNPIACAAALAHIDLIERLGLVHRALVLGAIIQEITSTWPGRLPGVREARGLGALQAVEFEPATPPSAARLMGAALRDGVIVLPEGRRAEVLAITPPLVISDQQVSHALAVLEGAISALAQLP